MDNLKERTARGLFWGLLNNGTMQVLNMLFGIVLARLLTPDDVGIVGVLTIFTVIAGNLQSSGFTQGLVNLKKPTARDYNSVFWFNVLASVALYATLFCAAPLIARFFHQPCLTRVSRLVFLGFLISSLGIAHNAYMIKNMMNRELAVASLSALVVSGTVGAVLAWRGWAYWSLAWQQVIYISVLNVGRYCYVPWRPQLKLDFGPVRQMLGFSVKILLTNIINTLSQHLLTVVFGRLFPMNAVGNYSQANNWNTKGHSLVSGAIAQVAQPVMVAAADDRERQQRVFRKMLRFTALLSFPLMLGLALVSREFVLIAIGRQWMGCVTLLQLLCLGGAFMPFYTLYQNMAISAGRSDVYLWCNTAQIALQLAIVLLFSRQGIELMVLAYTLFTILWLGAWQWFAHRLVGLRHADVLRDVLPFFLMAAATMGATWLLTRTIQSLWLLLAVRVAVAAVAYVALLRLSHAELLAECLQFLKRKA